MGDETIRVAQEVSHGLVHADVAKGVAFLRDLMEVSPQHAVFVARKMLLMEMDVGDEIRRRLLIPAIFDPCVAAEWFPLDDNVKARVEVMVDTLFSWYAVDQSKKPTLLTIDLVEGVCGKLRGNVSWVWVALAARLAEGGIALPKFPLTDREFATFTSRVGDAHALIQNEVVWYEAVLASRQKCKPPKAAPGSDLLSTAPDE